MENKENKEKKLIFKDHNLDEYNKKYGKKKLNKVSKADLAKDSSLLDHKAWWLIGDTYYEIPLNTGFSGWWTNLKPVFKGLIIGGTVAVVATAITLPIVLLNNNGGGGGGKDTTSYKVNNNEWLAALGTNIQIGNNTNVKITIKDQGDGKVTYYTYNIVGDRASCGTDYSIYYDLKDEYGYWKYQDGWETCSNAEDCYSVNGDMMKRIHSVQSAFTKYKYDETTKSYTYIGGSGSGESYVIGTIKFKDKKIESAVSINKKREYTFEYGTAAIDDAKFPKFGDNVKDFSYNQHIGTVSAHNIYGYDNITYRIKISELTESFASTNKLKCIINNIELGDSESLGWDEEHWQSAVSLENNEKIGLTEESFTYDKNNKKIEIIYVENKAGTITSSSKVLFNFETEMEHPNISLNVEVI